MNAISEWLRENDRSTAWLAKQVGMLPQTLGNKIRGLNDEQVLHTISLSEWIQITRVTGLPCPVCAQTEED